MRVPTFERLDTRRSISILPAAFLLGLLTAATAQASCGSAFCVLNTNWSTQGAASEPGSVRLDLRYEFVDQTHLRSGNREISRAQDTADATELRTINRNVLTTLDYAFSRTWSVSASLPVVSRAHSHIADPTGAATLEAWDFTRIADARVLGYYRFDHEGNPAQSYGLAFGAKLPTGDYRLRNADGTVAERALQPGTGSTDLVLGGHYSNSGFVPDSSWWAQALVQRAALTKDGYTPGNQVQLNLGYRHPVTDSLQALLQINTLVKQRDEGPNAERDLSGSKTVFASPGLSYAISTDAQLYGFVQLPVYRYVNGVQLSADRAWVGGVTVRF